MLGGRGAAVLCADRQPVEATVAAVAAAGGSAAAWRGDIAAPGAAEDIVEAAEHLGPALLGLVNNAGLVRDRMSFNLSDEDWDQVLAVNLTAPFRLCRAVTRRWRSAGNRDPRRRIVNTSSESGLFGNAGQANYASAKAGVAGLSLTLAAELTGSLGAGVNAVAPRARTPMSEAAFGAQGLREDLDPGFVAAVVAWLLSDLAAGVTGQVLVVAGRQVSRLRGWSGDERAEQPPGWTDASAEEFAARLFGASERANVPEPVGRLFAPVNDDGNGSR
jgi:3-oxoacyl-[acyl-carrier protein] reductase